MIPRQYTFSIVIQFFIHLIAIQMCKLTNSVAHLQTGSSKQASIIQARRDNVQLCDIEMGLIRNDCDSHVCMTRVRLQILILCIKRINIILFVLMSYYHIECSHINYHDKIWLRMSIFRLVWNLSNDPACNRPKDSNTQNHGPPLRASLKTPEYYNNMVQRGLRETLNQASIVRRGVKYSYR